MAIKKTETKEQKVKVEVKRVYEFKSGDISFDAVVNGVNIYGLTYINENPAKKIEKAFISFPSRKGSDGKYYNFVYFEITDELQHDIEKQIEAML